MDDDIELLAIASIFSQVPWEHGFSGLSGKKYEAIKDFLEWNEFDVQEWLPIVLQMANVWISAGQKTK